MHEDMEELQIHGDPAGLPTSQPVVRPNGHDMTIAASGTPAREQKRARLIAMLRGYYAAPVIATLGELGIAQQMLAGPFSVAGFASHAEEHTLAVLFRYLQGIGLLQATSDNRYELTLEGRTVFARNGAFSLLASYTEYFQNLPALLSGKPAHPAVDRARNVRGSGDLHSIKFFPSAFACFPSSAPTAILDLGCGDGRFLERACIEWPHVIPFGLDLSEKAVTATTRRLEQFSAPRPAAMVANAADVALWSHSLPAEIRESPRLVISMWFVGHEFSHGLPQTMVDFFTELHRRFPQAQVLLGEINNIAPADLVVDRDLSIMPEFLLFHELSGQGVLAWSDWRDILRNIPYHLEQECLFDEVRSGSGGATPASFLWLLQPGVSPSVQFA
jgi:SAM-dependent methyltransferase